MTSLEHLGMKNCEISNEGVFHLSKGKSNLMDAISFVLGESTKNLRVKKLSVSTMTFFLIASPLK